MPWREKKLNVGIFFVGKKIDGFKYLFLVKRQIIIVCLSKEKIDWRSNIFFEGVKAFFL